MRTRFNFRGRFRRNKQPPKRKHKINNEITAQKVRVIDEGGKVLGVMSIAEGMEKASILEVDLVEIVPESNPPVCKLVKYGKFIYQLDKKNKENKKNRKNVQLKEIKMRPKTDVHDYNFKIKHVKEFIAKGNKVKITIQFKGREMAFINLGKERMEKIINDTQDVAKVEIPSRLEGRNIHVTLSPLKKVKPKEQSKNTSSNMEK